MGLPHRNVIFSLVLLIGIVVLLLIVGSWAFAALRIIGPIGTLIIGLLVGHFLWRHPDS